MASGISQLASDVVFENQVLEKAFKRIVPFLFLLCFFAQLDRMNMGFAALAMNKDLKLTATMFGFANTVFYVGFAGCEIPSNMMLARFGARRWIGRILISWGIASAACMFAAGAHSLYGLRFILGIMEAGFMPGVFLYLTYWFPPTFRARATGLFLMAQGVTMAVGAQMSGFILQYGNGTLGIAGWRWLFLIEGLPAVVLGVITLFYLSDRPAMAKWLTMEEKTAIERRLQREQGRQGEHRKIWREVFSRKVIILALMYSGLVFGLNTSMTWTPQIVRDVIETRSLSYIGFLTAIPAICAVIFMAIWSTHSDRKMERIWHFALPVVLAVLGFVFIAFLRMPEARMLGLIFAGMGVLGAQPIFWSLPPHVISPVGRPVGMAFISSCGMVAAAISPLVVGFFRDLTHSWAASMMLIAIMLLVSAALAFLMPPEETSPAGA